MSHFAEMKVIALVKNEKDLVKALEGCFGGGNVEVHNNLVTLTGYDAGANKRANIIIRKDVVKKTFHNNGWNDIGFERKEDGTYDLHADPADWKTESRDKVMQAYAENVATRELRSEGYLVKRELLKNGEVRITGRKY